MHHPARAVVLGGLVLLLFSISPSAVSVRAQSEGDPASAVKPVHWWFGCYTCHTLHETENLALISEVVDTDWLPPEYALKSGLREVVFVSQEGPNSYADGDEVYDGICEICHTETRYHRGDGSGDRSHFPGARCTTCHDHDNYFQATGTADHPQAVTDCGNCHPPGRTGSSNLQEIHGFDCQQCHPDLIYERTILGGPGTFQGECYECHNPDMAETGNLQIPTKGHRCIVCHGRQMPTGNKTKFHKKHTKTANCVVCHGFIPDMGTDIGSGSREICRLCHDEPVDGIRITTLHREMVPAGLSCLECHGDARPPIDVIPVAPVGDAGTVCEICHDGRNPALFSYRSERLHRRHAEKQLDCGFCHNDAILQDDSLSTAPVRPNAGSVIRPAAGAAAEGVETTPGRRYIECMRQDIVSGATTAMREATAGRRAWCRRSPSRPKPAGCATIEIAIAARFPFRSTNNTPA